MVEEECSLSARDAQTGAIIAVQMARSQLEHGNLRRADENLSVAQRALLGAGAKDIGRIPNGRPDLPTDLYSESRELKRKLRRKEERIAQLEEKLEEQSEESPNWRLRSLFSW